MSLTQLSRLLPLPQPELQQILDHGLTLTPAEAAAHLSNLLGDTPAAIEFIAEFNSRRRTRGQDAGGGKQASSASRDAPLASGNEGGAADRYDGVPKPAARGSRKQKPPLHGLPARQVVVDPNAPGTVYRKGDISDGATTSGREGNRGTAMKSAGSPRNSTIKPGQGLSATPVVVQTPVPTSTASTTAPSTARQAHAPGYLISDGPPSRATKSQSRSTGSSRHTSPHRSQASTTAKITLAGGTPMHGASTALTELDSAIRALEVSTNVSKTGDVAARRCNCMATRHDLLAAAPNCLACGKIICVREGLGPCTFCGTDLLSAGQKRDMIASLREERGRERMAAHNGGQSRQGKPSGSSTARGGGGGAHGYTVTNGWQAGLSPAEAQALEASTQAQAHRDRLLAYQAQNAARTTVHDEAADFDVDASGRGMAWMTPTQRAAELKRQQRVLAEMQWNAAPEHEKRRQVVSIDLSGGKAVKRIVQVERPKVEMEVEDEPARYDGNEAVDGPSGGSGRRDGERGGLGLSKNPLLGALVRPRYTMASTGQMEGHHGGLNTHPPNSTTTLDTGKGKGKTKAIGISSNEPSSNIDATNSKADDAAAPAAPRQRRTWRRVQDDLDDNEAVILDGGVYGGTYGSAHGGAHAHQERESSGRMLSDEPACG